VISFANPYVQKPAKIQLAANQRLEEPMRDPPAFCPRYVMRFHPQREIMRHEARAEGIGTASSYGKGSVQNGGSVMKPPAVPKEKSRILHAAGDRHIPDGKSRQRKSPARVAKYPKANTKLISGFRSLSGGVEVAEFFEHADAGGKLLFGEGL